MTFYSHFCVTDVVLVLFTSFTESISFSEYLNYMRCHVRFCSSPNAWCARDVFPQLHILSLEWWRLETKFKCYFTISFHESITILILVWIRFIYLFISSSSSNSSFQSCRHLFTKFQDEIFPRFRSTTCFTLPDSIPSRINNTQYAESNREMNTKPKTNILCLCVEYNLNVSLDVKMFF